MSLTLGVDATDWFACFNCLLFSFGVLVFIVICVFIYMYNSVGNFNCMILLILDFEL